MPSARRPKHRSVGWEIRSTMGRAEEAVKAAKRALSVTKTGLRGNLRRARMFIIQSHRAAKSWHIPQEL